MHQRACRITIVQNTTCYFIQRHNNGENLILIGKEVLRLKIFCTTQRFQVDVYRKDSTLILQ